MKEYKDGHFEIPAASLSTNPECWPDLNVGTHCVGRPHFDSYEGWPRMATDSDKKKSLISSQIKVTGKQSHS